MSTNTEKNAAALESNAAATAFVANGVSLPKKSVKGQPKADSAAAERAKEFKRALGRAKAGQAKANAAWKAAQEHAFLILSLDRNATPLSELVQAAYAAKNVRAQVLLDFTLHVMALGQAEGARAVLAWDEKNMSFSFTKTKDKTDKLNITSAGLKIATTVAWYDWEGGKKEATKPTPKFSALFAAIKTMNKHASAGTVTMTAEEKAFLRAVNQAAVAAGLAEKLESK